MTFACRRPGTRFATPNGETPIEDLRIGDLLITHTGKTRPLKWIGRRTYVASFVAANPQLRPVRIRAHAIAAGIPARDLLVSAQHAVLVRVSRAGDVLIPAGALVNGVSILRDPPTQGIAYLHLELEERDLIQAEGLAVETFVGPDGRGIFQNAAEFAALYPDHIATEPAHRLPRLEEGFAVASAYRHIAARAGLARPANPPGALRGQVERIVDHPDGLLIEGWVFDESDPETAQKLEIPIPGASPVRILANRYRADLDRAGLAGGRCAFSQIIPTTTGGVYVYRVADGAVLKGATEISHTP